MFYKTPFFCILPQQGWIRDDFSHLAKSKTLVIETKEYSLLAFSTVPKTRTHWQVSRPSKMYSRLTEVYTFNDPVSVYSKAKSSEDGRGRATIQWQMNFDLCSSIAGKTFVLTSFHWI